MTQSEQSLDTNTTWRSLFYRRHTDPHGVADGNERKSIVYTE